MSASTGSLAAGLLAAGAGPGAASGAALGATSRQLNAAVSAVITATRWLPAEELKRNADLYRDCGQLHRRSAQLVVRLRRLLLALATPALGAPTPGTPAPGTGSTQCPAGRSFDIQVSSVRALPKQNRKVKETSERRHRGHNDVQRTSVMTSE